MRRRGSFDPGMGDLPDEIPVFPLPGALLLPRGHLPLNIFEPRYLAMTSDALGAPGRMIGMIQPHAAETDASPSGPVPLCRTGCAGRITAFSETDDGRFLITLTGVARFHADEELAPAPGGYRRIAPDFAPFLGDLNAPGAIGIDRERLRTVLATYFDLNRIRACWDTISDTDDETLVTSLAMACAFSLCRSMRMPSVFRLRMARKLSNGLATLPTALCR